MSGEHESLVLAQVGDEVAGVEEGVLGQADVDERGLHPGENVRYDALVDVPDDGAVAAALDEQLGEDAAVEHGDARFADSGVDDDVTWHEWVAPAGAPAAPGPSRPPDHGARGRTPGPGGPSRPPARPGRTGTMGMAQANRRIRTLAIRATAPTAVRRAEPP
jgi:hypothetical protein